MEEQVTAQGGTGYFASYFASFFTPYTPSSPNFVKMADFTANKVFMPNNYSNVALDKML